LSKKSISDVKIHSTKKGPKDKKFKASAFKKLLLSIQHEPMVKQQQIIADTFNNWKGKTEQVDDVCVIGVRI